MLNISILEPGKNVTLGSTVLRSLQNESTPKGDLLIRESFQNSLDAVKKESQKVHIDVSTGKFATKLFATKLERLGPILQKKYNAEESFIAIKDSGTFGLTGEMHHNDIQGQDYGNLIKLVYDIGKPQEDIGAGGSWGYGKTIYYRMGIGLVVYYSRIELSQNRYEERLAITMVEDEREEKAIIPPFSDKGTTKSGIAWWGDKYLENDTKPVTDSRKIHEILKIFNISPYKVKETGTTVIIPFIDEEEIIKNNQFELMDQKFSSEMYFNLEEYFEDAIQRWYAPRLNNINYPAGSKRYLTASINEAEITKEKQIPYFNYIRDMYNYAQHNDPRLITSIENKSNVYREEIKLRASLGVTFDENTVGYLVYAKFNYKELGMSQIYDSNNPYFNSNIARSNNKTNPIIVTFCRQPGMLVNYEITGDWAGNLPEMEPGEYVIALFVLNSDNEISTGNEKKTLEEYIRQGEMADHIKWDDHSKFFGVNPGIVRRIRSSVTNLLRSTYSVSPEEIITDNDGRLSQKAADLILPSTDYGKKASIDREKTKKTNNITRLGRGFKSTIKHDEIQYSTDGITIPFQFTIESNTVERIGVELEIKQEKKSISIENFETQVGIKSPLSFRSVEFDSDIFGKISSEGNNLKNEIVTVETKFKTIHEFSISKQFEKNEIVKGFVIIKGESQALAPVLRLKGEKVI